MSPQEQKLKREKTREKSAKNDDSTMFKKKEDRKSINIKKSKINFTLNYETNNSRVSC